MTQNQEKSGFDYCFWAKLMVAIPTLPMAALIAASYFEDEMSRGVAAVLAVIGIVALSRWVDRLPIFQKKIQLKK